MSLHNPLLLALIYLSAMVVSVLVARKVGLGMVLGYLLAGVALGPSVFGVLGQEQGEVLHLAEFGIVMMLFLIGLELQPSLLWKRRGSLLGLGGLQVALTTAALAALGMIAGLGWREALGVGMILSLSSTATVLQSLQEKGALKTSGGEAAFAVLLFQDIAVIPILALIPVLAGKGAPTPDDAATIGGLRILAAVTLVVVTGRYLARPLFRITAASHLRELFTALALLLVLAVTYLMNAVGLSPALGAFLGGVVLADSEYRHQLQADIEPFKGLLLGAFFISVGAGIDFSVLGRSPGLAAGGILALVGLKWILLLLIARAGKLPKPDALLFAFSLAQGGEFAFVLLGFAQKAGLMPGERAQSLTAFVAISMILAPFLIQAYFAWIQPRFAAPAASPERAPDEIDAQERENPVIVAGFGRFGQMVTRFLKARGIRATVLDYDVEQIDILRRFGAKAFYGDASRMDLLHAAGAAQAKLLVIAIDDVERALEMIELVRKEFPRLRILARAYDRLQAYEMIHRGVEHPFIETAGSALNLGIEALTILGVPEEEARRSAEIFNRYNDQSIRELAKVYHEADEGTFLAQTKDWLSALEDVLKSDRTG